MVLGVALFIVMMTAATCTERFERLRSRRCMERTLVIGYGARVAISVLFPVGMYADLPSGMLSISLVENAGIATHSFAGTLIITVVQGVMLNAILMMFMFVTYWFLRLTGIKDRPRHGTSCVRCGYDLRGHSRSSACPECGTVPANDEEPSPAVS